MVFLVCAGYPFSSSVPVRAFLDSIQAEKFCTQCNTYQAVVSQSNGFEEFSERDQQWRSGHHAGDIGSASDSFSVMPIELGNEQEKMDVTDQQPTIYSKVLLFNGRLTGDTEDSYLVVLKYRKPTNIFALPLYWLRQIPSSLIKVYVSEAKYINCQQESDGTYSVTVGSNRHFDGLESIDGFRELVRRVSNKNVEKSNPLTVEKAVTGFYDKL